MVDFMNFKNYSCNNQMSIFDFTRKTISITKPIRLIELFAGYGSQAMALKRMFQNLNINQDIQEKK